MNHLQLETQLNELLTPESIKDYCPNGLQVEGRENVQKVVTGVTASDDLIEQAIESNADAILVHHGYFWKGEPEPIRGMKGKRLKKLIQKEINLYAYHLPLDMHPTLGNNIQLARLLNIEVKGEVELVSPPLVLHGTLPYSMTGEQFSEYLADKLDRSPLHIPPGSDRKILTVGWCTGGGQDYIDVAAAYGLDAFISGEISERTTYSAREQDIHYFSAGHHATERYGVKALGEWLAENHQLDVQFIDIDNPV